MHIDNLMHRIKSAVDACALPLYLAFGRKPWSIGYYTAKKRAIAAAIDGEAVLPGKQLPDGFGIALDERVVEYAWLFGHLRHSQSGFGRLLDAGSILNHDFILSRAPLKGGNLTIVTLAPEKSCQWYDGYSYVFGDLRQTLFKDNAFDTLVCISTIEHVGLDNTLLYTSDRERAESDGKSFLAAVDEFKRILTPGGVCYITFPFGRYQNFGWYQVFNRAMVGQIIERFAPASHTVEYFGYRESGWQRALPEQVENAVAFDVHSGQNRGNDRAASSRAIACLRMIA